MERAGRPQAAREAVRIVRADRPAHHPGPQAPVQDPVFVTRRASVAGREHKLPESLPLFPLSGVLLLPHGRLPLNVFEPRYLNMTEDALGAGRLIGMIQPKEP